MAADPDYAAFLAFKAAQAAGQLPGQLQQERPKPSFRDVLKALVDRASLASENLVRDFHDAIDAFCDTVEGTNTPTESAPSGE